MNTASIHRVSWKHYLGAAVASYLSPWLAAYFGYVFFHLCLGFPPSWLLPADTIPAFYMYIPIPPFLAFWAVLVPAVIWAFLDTLIPAAISFLILLPFLRSRSRRLLAYFFICVGWVLLVGFTPYYTRWWPCGLTHHEAVWKLPRWISVMIKF